MVVDVVEVALRVELLEGGPEQAVLHDRELSLLAQKGHQGVLKLLEVLSASCCWGK